VKDAEVADAPHELLEERDAAHGVAARVQRRREHSDAHHLRSGTTWTEGAHPTRVTMTVTANQSWGEKGRRSERKKKVKIACESARECEGL
jgi:hypothetical protein